MCMTSATYSRVVAVAPTQGGGSYGRGCRGVAVSECRQYNPNSPPTRNRGPPHGHQGQGNTEYAPHKRSKHKHTK